MSTPQPESAPNESLEELLGRGKPHPPCGEQVIEDLPPEEAEAFLAAVLN